MKKMMIGGTVAVLLVLGSIGGVWGAETGIPQVENEQTIDHRLHSKEKVDSRSSDDSFSRMDRSCHHHGQVARDHDGSRMHKGHGWGMHGES